MICLMPERSTVSRARYHDLGLLLLRLGFGLSMALFHGWGKISGGPERWERLGASMQNLGIDMFPTFFGFMAGFSEFCGSLLLVLGLFFRPATALLAFTMLVASARHLSLPAGTDGAGLAGASHALEYLVLYVALLIMGPGRYSVAHWWKQRNK
jgi:putative oxidoreductase